VPTFHISTATDTENENNTFEMNILSINLQKRAYCVSAGVRVK